MKSSFYSEDELKGLGLASFGHNILVSRHARVYAPETIKIGNNVRIDDFCILSGGKGIYLGSYIHISPYSAIYGGGKVVIKDYCGLSPRCILFSETDDFSGKSMVHSFFSKDLKPGYISREIVLNRFVQIGANSTVLPGVELGEGAAIGAHSLVTKSCEPWGIYAGVPAKKIKNRSKKLLELEKQFLESQGEYT